MLPRPALPSKDKIRAQTISIFQRRPCELQVNICLALLRREKNVVCAVSTGFGKTLTFMMPLLFDEQSIIIVVTALNILGSQNVDALDKVGISAIAINGRNNTDAKFQEIKDYRYRFVVVSPEILMEKSGRFDKLWKAKGFTQRLMPMVFDEAHCISRWGSFRPEYKEIGRLRYLLPQDIKFYVTSATLSPPVLSDISELLHLNKTNTESYLRPNDRPNVFLSVRKMTHPAKSFRDLDFLIPKDGTPVVKKFLIFFDSIKGAEACCKYLRSRLGADHQDSVIWYHSIMTDEFREDEAKLIVNGERSGACATESFGMGMDIPDITLVIQWKLTCNIETLWQRFGRGARDSALEAVAILFTEPQHFDDEKRKAEDRKEVRAAKKVKRDDNIQLKDGGKATTKKRKRADSESVKDNATLEKVRGKRRAVAIPTSTSHAAHTSNIVHDSDLSQVHMECDPPQNPLQLSLQRAYPVHTVENGTIDDNAAAATIDSDTSFAESTAQTMAQLNGFGSTTAEPKDQDDMEEDEDSMLVDSPIPSSSHLPRDNPERTMAMDASSVDTAATVCFSPDADVPSQAGLVDVETGAATAREGRDRSDSSLREKYHIKAKQASSSRAPTRVKRSEIDPVMSDFVNAKARGLGCRRRIPRLYFGGISPAEEHPACNPELLEGCARCKPTVSRLCCDICTPTILSDMGLQLDRGEPGSSAPLAASRRSNVAKREATQPDRSFSRRVFDWRDLKAKSKLSHAVYSNLGPAVFLSDELIDRLVLCAGAGKLVTVADVLRETRWNGAEEHGQDILEIVKDIYKVNSDNAPEKSASVRPSAPSSKGTERSRRATTCSRCQQVGHNSRNLDCPGRLENRENMPASSSTSTAAVAQSAVGSFAHPTPDPSGPPLRSVTNFSFHVPTSLALLSPTTLPNPQYVSPGMRRVLAPRATRGRRSVHRPSAKHPAAAGPSHL